MVDLQHGLIDYQMALPMIQAIGAASDAHGDRAPALERAGHASSSCWMPAPGAFSAR